MKFTFFILSIMFSSSIAFCQSSIHVKGKDYEGYIFNKEHFVFGTVEKQKDRYTPTMNDIKCIEQILKNNVDYIKDNQTEKIKGYPVIYRNMNKYKRQYIGYQTQSGDIIIWVNFLKDYDNQSALAQDIIYVNDGGSYYWSVFINMTKKELFNMRINGRS